MKDLALFAAYATLVNLSPGKGTKTSQTDARAAATRDHKCPNQDPYFE